MRTSMTKIKNSRFIYSQYRWNTHKESINQFYFANCAHLSAVLQIQRYSAKYNTTQFEFEIIRDVEANPAGPVIYHVKKFWNWVM